MKRETCGELSTGFSFHIQIKIIEVDLVPPAVHEAEFFQHSLC